MTVKAPRHYYSCSVCRALREKCRDHRNVLAGGLRQDHKQYNQWTSEDRPRLAGGGLLGTGWRADRWVPSLLCGPYMPVS